MKLTKDILAKIDELHKKYPNITSVSFGKKTKDGVATGEYSINVTVEKKKPLSELKSSEVIESTVQVGDTILKTDVSEMSQPITLNCGDNLSSGGCGFFPAGPNNQENRATQQVIKGGLSMSTENNDCTVGTLGGIVNHPKSGCVVGLTNNHVSIGDAFYTAYRDVNGIKENEYDPVNRSFQTGEGNWNSATNLGVSLRYVPIHPVSSGIANQVDAALTSLDASRFDQNESWLQEGLESILGTNPPPFASSIEIDNLVNTNPRVYSTGRTLGPKGLMPNCPVVITDIGVSFNIGYQLQKPGGLCPGNQYQEMCFFNNIIKYAKPLPSNPNNQNITIFDGTGTNGCWNPVYSGDSGSMLLADINGTIKIIGLVFAGSVGAYTTTNQPLFTY